jgi:hypothetical protein
MRQGEGDGSNTARRTRPRGSLSARLAAVAALLAVLVPLLVQVPASKAAPVLTPVLAPAAAPPSVGGCPMLPADNVWNTRIDMLPVHARSANWITSIGGSSGMKADFGSGLWDGYPIGIPYTSAPGSQAAVSIDFYYGSQSDPGPYRLPPDSPIEGGGDHHVLVVDRDRCLLTEVYDATKLSDTAWDAGSGAIFDLNSNALRPDGWTSADAAGLPILPGLVRYDEVLAGEIAHALRFTAAQTQRAYLWPARHYASSNTNVNVPPMGARVRLKQSVAISGYAPEVQVILLAMKRYGMFLADNGSNWYINGAPDEGWDNDMLRELRYIKGSDLEFVDESSLMVHPDSGQARSTPPGTPTAGTPTAGTPPPMHTPPPTLTPTQTATATLTLTPTPRPSCQPRPPARVDVVRTTPGQYTVTVAAGVGSGAPHNRLRALRFGAAVNASIRLNGQAVASGTRVPFANGAEQATFVVARTAAGAGATVPLVLEDDCGDWSTFVGGGASAW